MQQETNTKGLFEIIKLINGKKTLKTGKLKGQTNEIYKTDKVIRNRLVKNFTTLYSLSKTKHRRREITDDINYQTTNINEEIFSKKINDVRNKYP